MNAPLPKGHNARKGCVGFRRIPIEERFAALSRWEQGCLIWIGSVSPKGYGLITIDGKTRRAHRAHYELRRGPVAAELHMDHLCRNRRCINPDHLEPVTPRENIMRGFGAWAINARKTHCKWGHPLAGDNLFIKKATGSRRCLICHRATSARSAAKRRAR